jgi:hypothetical protein
MGLWSFLQCFGLLDVSAIVYLESAHIKTEQRIVHDGSEPFCPAFNATHEHESNDIIAHGPPGGSLRMIFSSIEGGKIGQPKVIKVCSAYYRWDPEDTGPVIDELRVVIGWEGSKVTDTKTLKYNEVKDMDGAEDAIAEFGLM